MEINEVKRAMATGQTVVFDGIRCTIMEYRLKLCRNNPTKKKEEKAFYHTLLLQDQNARQTTYEVPLESVEKLKQSP